MFTLGTSRALNALYSVSQRLQPVEQRIGIGSSSFPPNGREFYFHLFGKNGFREYQVLVPRDGWKAFEDALPNLVARHRAPITLGSLKLFRGERGLLHFDGAGVCMAIDVPEGKAGHALFAGLDELTSAVKGIVNIAKDSRVTAQLVSQLFPEYDLFRTKLNEFDPRRRFDSALRRRLDV